MSVLNGQFPGVGLVGNAEPVAQFEYLWDRADNDFSGGKAEGFEDPANNGVPKEENVAGNHEKSVRAIEWLAANFPTTSYAVHAHTERQGAYVSTEDRGYNVEHIRDWHNAGLLDAAKPQGESLAFGTESQPGHQFASPARGTYQASRPSACFWTYGGTGCYAGA